MHVPLKWIFYSINVGQAASQTLVMKVMAKILTDRNMGYLVSSMYFNVRGEKMSFKQEEDLFRDSVVGGCDKSMT